MGEFVRAGLEPSWRKVAILLLNGASKQDKSVRPDGQLAPLRNVDKD